MLTGCRCKLTCLPCRPTETLRSRVTRVRTGREGGLQHSHTGPAPVPSTRLTHAVPTLCGASKSGSVAGLFYSTDARNRSRERDTRGGGPMHTHHSGQNVGFVGPAVKTTHAWSRVPLGKRQQQVSSLVCHHESIDESDLVHQVGREYVCTPIRHATADPRTATLHADTRHQTPHKRLDPKQAGHLLLDWFENCMLSATISPTLVPAVSKTR